MFNIAGGGMDKEGNGTMLLTNSANSMASSDPLRRSRSCWVSDPWFAHALVSSNPAQRSRWATPTPRPTAPVPRCGLAGGYNINNPITVANQPTTGTYTINADTTGNATLRQPVTLNQNLTVVQASGGTLDYRRRQCRHAAAGSPTVTFAGPGTSMLQATA